MKEKETETTTEAVDTPVAPAPVWAHDLAKRAGGLIPLGGHFFRLDSWGPSGVYLAYVKPGTKRARQIKERKDDITSD
jgi:hypothetical protein